MRSWKNKRLNRKVDKDIKGFNLTAAEIAGIKSSRRMIQSYKDSIRGMKLGRFNKTFCKADRVEFLKHYKDQIKKEEENIKRYQGEMV